MFQQYHIFRQYHISQQYQHSQLCPLRQRSLRFQLCRSVPQYPFFQASHFILLFLHFRRPPWRSRQYCPPHPSSRQRTSRHLLQRWPLKRLVRVRKARVVKRGKVKVVRRGKGTAREARAGKEKARVAKGEKERARRKGKTRVKRKVSRSRLFPLCSSLRHCHRPRRRLGPPYCMEPFSRRLRSLQYQVVESPTIVKAERAKVARIKVVASRPTVKRERAKVARVKVVGNRPRVKRERAKRTRMDHRVARRARSKQSPQC